MRIEYQGHVEVTPPYAHVGYTAAMAMPSVYTGNPGAAGVYLGLALLFAVAAQRFSVSRKSTVHLLAFLTSIVLCGAMAVTSVMALRDYDLTPPFTLTIQRLERLCEATEAFERQRGRLPTQQEWAALAAPLGASDAWGEPFVYLTQNAQYTSGDGQQYQVTVGEETAQRTGPLSSACFGPDGLFGTRDDDARAAHVLGNLHYRQVDLVTFPHARSARTPVRAG